MTTEVDWLLASREPAVRLMTRRDLLDEHPNDAEQRSVLKGKWIRALLAGQDEDGGFGGHPYDKWTGAYWRLISLVELAVPPGEPRALAALDQVLRWRERSRRYVKDVAGRARTCASMDGNALNLAVRLGQTEDPRLPDIAEALIGWQWEDGGWNCDRNPRAHRSSFHETLNTAAGLHAYGSALGSPEALSAASRAAELLLSHRLFRRLSDGEVINSAWLVPHYPPYWHYETLHALLVLSRMGLVEDPRASDALDLLEGRRGEDGRWSVQGCWFKPDSKAVPPDVVDWGSRGPHEMLTLNALRVLRAAGR